MAAGLVQVRRRGAFREWGYADFHEYCDRELQLKRPTVDKLTVSYTTLVEHAPSVLQRDGVAQPIPAYDAVDYFARALRRELPANDDTPDRDDAVAELRTAVFDDLRPVADLRKQFDPVFHPRPPGAEEIERFAKARAATRRLRACLDDLEGLDSTRTNRLLRDLEGLEGELDRKLQSGRLRKE
jgi:hypothetical protein